MNIRRFNWPLWTGLLLTFAAFMSYFFIFVLVSGYTRFSVGQPVALSYSQECCCSWDCDVALRRQIASNALEDR